MELGGPDGPAVLLDAGEGTLGQLYRVRGHAAAPALLARIAAVLVSHMHADHHLGLVAVLQDRHRLGHALPPLVVVGPAPLAAYLAELGQAVPLAPYQFLDAVGLTPRSLAAAASTNAEAGRRAGSGGSDSDDDVGSGGDGGAGSGDATATSPLGSTDLTTRLGVARVEAVPVVHCPLSYGYVLVQTGVRPWKLVYVADVPVRAAGGGGSVHTALLRCVARWRGSSLACHRHVLAATQVFR